MDFVIPGSRSLKDKRRAMKSLKTLLHNRFNCSVAETDFQDKWGRSRLAVCVVSDEGSHVSEQLQEIVRFSSNHHEAQMTNYTIENL